jgi:pimeloyl-ACP methyl ester carboxylesterase
VSVPTEPPAGGLLYHEIERGPEGADWLVFLHGAGGSMFTFKRQFPHFAGRFHLLKIDLRDHGQSKGLPVPDDFGMYTVARDVIALLDHLGIREAHFMGVSMGSIFVRLVDELHPDVVRSVVVGGGVFRLSAKIQGFIRGGVLLARVLSFRTLYRLLATIIMPARNHAKSREIFIREAEKISQAEFNRWLRLAPELRGQLRRHFDAPISGPTLVVMGAEDHVFLGPAREYATRWDGVDLAVIPKCGHVCNIEQPEAFHRLVDAWFAERFGIPPTGEGSGA